MSKSGKHCVRSYRNRLHAEHHFTLLLHGDARGADRLAGEWAQERGIEVLACPADWKRHRRGAGPIRNRQMLDERPDLMAAFPGGAGTRNMIEIARTARLRVIVVESPAAGQSAD